jgi:hypothetical protein
MIPKFIGVFPYICGVSTEASIVDTHEAGYSGRLRGNSVILRAARPDGSGREDQREPTRRGETAMHLVVMWSRVLHGELSPSALWELFGGFLPALQFASPYPTMFPLDSSQFPLGGVPASIQQFDSLQEDPKVKAKRERIAKTKRRRMSGLHGIPNFHREWLRRAISSGMKKPSTTRKILSSREQPCWPFIERAWKHTNILRKVKNHADHKKGGCHRSSQ